MCFRNIPVFNANTLEPDQVPCSAASDLGLDCLPMSLLWDARHKSVKQFFTINRLLVVIRTLHVSMYSRTSIARTSLVPWKFVRDMRSSSK